MKFYDFCRKPSIEQANLLALRKWIEQSFRCAEGDEKWEAVWDALVIEILTSDADRQRLAELAEAKCDVDGKREAYCRRAVENIAKRGLAKKRKQERPLVANIKRQLRENYLPVLEAKGILQHAEVGPNMLLWGLCEWGENWTQRSPSTALDDLTRLTSGVQVQRGKYETVLMPLVPKLIERYGAGMMVYELAETISTVHRDQLDDPEQFQTAGSSRTDRRDSNAVPNEFKLVERLRREIERDPGFDEIDLRILDLYTRDDKTQAEIANILSLNRNTINMRYRRIVSFGMRNRDALLGGVP